MTHNKGYDVAIIGGGIIGCSTLFHLTKQGYECVLLEKNSQLMGEASAGNSGMLHTGFDAPLNSLEMDSIKRCQREIFNTLDTLKVPYNKCGTVLVAWAEQEKYDISKLYEKTQQAELGEDISILSESSLRQLEPGLAGGAWGGLHVPGETMVDSWLLGIALAHHARTQGAKVLTDCKVTSAHKGHLDTTRGKVKAQVVINCAGLHGDLVDCLQGVQTYRILPRMGQYSVFSKKASHLFKSIIFPVPTEKSKGIAVFKSVYGNVISGPTAVDITSRSLPPSDAATHDMLTDHAKHILPGLTDYNPIGGYMGLRPATQFKDYQIIPHLDKRWISVGGIRSTGVSASLGVAEYVTDLVTNQMGLEPSRGSSGTNTDISWRTVDGGKMVLFDDTHSYRATHPMFTFGHMGEGSKL